ncbi:conserved protein, unknown function, partial [Hepatocystis sp. ex Piliocolobus tephrosceles]
MFAFKYVIFFLFWICQYDKIAQNSFFSIQRKKPFNQINRRILRLDTPENWSESETYELITINENGDKITTVYDKDGEVLFFIITRSMKSHRKSKKIPKESDKQTPEQTPEKKESDEQTPEQTPEKN